MKTKATRNCSQCGSPLVLLNEVTELKEGSRFPQTSTTYRCSNESCQAEKDKQTAKRVKMLQDKEKADAKRLEEKQRDKKEV